jgi:hypothetical protein
MAVAPVGTTTCIGNTNGVVMESQSKVTTAKLEDAPVGTTTCTGNTSDAVMESQSQSKVTTEKLDDAPVGTTTCIITTNDVMTLSKSEEDKQHGKKKKVAVPVDEVVLPNVKHTFWPWVHKAAHSLSLVPPNADVINADSIIHTDMHEALFMFSDVYLGRRSWKKF